MNKTMEIREETFRLARQCKKNFAKCAICHYRFEGATGTLLGCKADLETKTEKGE